MKEKIVLPGDRIGTPEEFRVGKGVYEENKELFAQVVGILEIKGKTASIRELKKIPEIKRNDVIVGRVIDVRGNFAMVEIARKKGEDRDLKYTNLGFLHISNVGKGFDSIGVAIGYFDIIKARVLDPSPKLSIDEPEMGVIKAFCSSCKSELILYEGKLKCPKCGKEESRKISNSYGKGEW